MMTGALGTTNLILGILAAVIVLQMLLLIGAGIAIVAVYRRVMTLVDDIETRQVAPAMARLNAILDDVKQVSATVREESDRVDRAIRSTIDRVDETADKVRSNVRVKTRWIIGALRGLSVAIAQILQSGSRHQQPPAGSAERVM
jgi:hypothetical protein